MSEEVLESICSAFFVSENIFSYVQVNYMLRLLQEETLVMLLSENAQVNQLLPANLESVCKETGQALEMNYREGFDHSYYFITSFFADHINFHAKYLLA